MSQTIQAVYTQGVLRPLVPLDLPENSAVEITLQITASPELTMNERVRQALLTAGLLADDFDGPANEPLDPQCRTGLAHIFATGPPLGDYINEDREARP